MYKYIDCHQPTYFNVDDTLVMWNVPLTKGAINVNGSQVMPNQGNIDALKRHSMRGHTIIVWSAGGSQWAKAVVDALGLQDHVNAIMEKPMWYYDDKQSSHFMGEAQYNEYKPKEPK